MMKILGYISMVMKKFLFPVLLVILVAGWMAYDNQPVDFQAETESGIHFFKGTMADAQVKADVEKKLIFMDVYATWCGPCKRLKTKTFSEKKVGDLFNNRFVNLAIDGETEEGRQIMKKYGLTSYPTLMFLKPDGSIVEVALGFHSPKELIEIGQKLAP